MTQVPISMIGMIASALPQGTPSAGWSGRALVTVVGNENGRANKRISRSNADDEPTKDGATQISRACARTFEVKGPEDLEQLLRLVGEHEEACLWLGYPEGVKAGEPFKILSKREMGQAIGCEVEDQDALAGWHELDGMRACCRLKTNALHSTWMLLDRDIPDDMPPQWAQADQDGWWEQMCEIAPPLRGAARVVLPSTSSRVLVDGEPCSSKASSHTFVQVKDPDDVPRFMAAMELRGAETGKIYPRPCRARKGENVIAHAKGYLFDPATKSPERLVYDGKPSVDGPGLEVAEVEVQVFLGACVDTALLPLPDAATAKRIFREHGLRVEQTTETYQSASGQTRTVTSWHVLDRDTLKLSTVIETQHHGFMTLGNIWLEHEGEHIRCQAPFRESESWAAYVGFHEDGMPFLYDTGGGPTKYILSGDDRRGPEPEEYLSNIEELIGCARPFGEIARELGEHWCRACRALVMHKTSDLQIGAAVEGIVTRLREAGSGAPDKRTLQRDLRATLQEAKRAAQPLARMRTALRRRRRRS